MEFQDWMLIAAIIVIAYSILMLVAVFNIWRLLAKIAGEEDDIQTGDN